MLRSLWLLALYLSFIGLGFSAPFVLTLGYVWVDIFRPQEVAYILLNQFPVSMIMGLLALGSYFLLDRRSPPPLNGVTMVHFCMAIWTCVTMIWAVSPDAAWYKWDWAFKTVAFSAFLPFVIRSRVQIEAFVQVFVFSLGANFISFGIKTLISGGGYGTNLGLQQGNTGLSEGGLLSTTCLMVVPLALYLAKHHQLMPKLPFIRFGYFGLAGLSLATAIGTYQRSAIIGMVALGGFLAVRSRHKLAYTLAGVVVLGILAVATSDQWLGRVGSIGQYKEDSSAMTRLLMWKWTLDFSFRQPLGGAFSAHMISSISHPPSPTNPGGFIEFSRAFHSIYFEMLGEQGWPGLAMFVFMTLATMFSTYRLERKTKKIPELLWCSDLAVAIQAGLVAFLTAGAFVGMVFQPMYWFFIAMGVSLRAYVWRVEQMDRAPQTGWRATATSLAESAGPVTPGGWRPATIQGGLAPQRGRRTS